jgi:hypothetical protein
MTYRTVKNGMEEEDSRHRMETPVSRAFVDRSTAFPGENLFEPILEQREEHQPPFRSNTYFGIANRRAHD